MNRNQTTVSVQQEPPVSGEHKKRAISPQAMEFMIRLGATALTIWLLLTFVTGIFVCHSDACSPMVKDGDLCVTWKPGAPSAGDLIVYSHDGMTRFGRVVAVAGDRVELINNTLWVNGFMAISEPLPDGSANELAVRFPYTVPENSVFVLCDNRADNGDSRTYGAIPLADVRGTVIFLMRRRGI